MRVFHLKQFNDRISDVFFIRVFLFSSRLSWITETQPDGDERALGVGPRRRHRVDEALEPDGDEDRAAPVVGRVG